MNNSLLRWDYIIMRLYRLVTKSKNKHSTPLINAFPLKGLPLLYTIKYTIRVINQAHPRKDTQYGFAWVLHAIQSNIKNIGVYSSMFWCARNILSNSGFPVIAGGMTQSLGRDIHTLNHIANCVTIVASVIMIKYVSMVS